MFSEIDAMKFISSMTLFSQVCNDQIFRTALTLFNHGELDLRTIELLKDG